MTYCYSLHSLPSFLSNVIRILIYLNLFFLLPQRMLGASCSRMLLVRSIFSLLLEQYKSMRMAIVVAE